MDKTLEIATKLAETMFNGVANVVDKYGPVAVDTTLWIVRLDSIQNLVIALIFFVWLIVSCFYLIPKWAKDIRESRNEIACMGYATSIALSIVADLAAIILFFTVIVNVWTYIAIAKPELYLAKKIYDKVLSETK